MSLVKLRLTDGARITKFKGKFFDNGRISNTLSGNDPRLYRHFTWRAASSAPTRSWPAEPATATAGRP